MKLILKFEFFDLLKANEWQQINICSTYLFIVNWIKSNDNQTC